MPKLRTRLATTMAINNFERESSKTRKHDQYITLLYHQAIQHIKEYTYIITFRMLKILDAKIYEHSYEMCT